MLLRLLPLAALLLVAQGMCDCQHTDRLLIPDELINFDHNTAGQWAISVASVTEGGHTKQSITTRVGDGIQRTVRSREGSKGWTYEDPPAKTLTHDSDSTPKKVHRGCKRTVQTTEEAPSLQSHKGYSVGQWVGVMEYSLEGGIWHHNGRHQHARITRIHPDGSFALERRSGEPVISAFKSGIRHWHLKAQPQPAAPASCGDAAKHQQQAQQRAAAPAGTREAPAAPPTCPKTCHGEGNLQGFRRVRGGICYDGNPRFDGIALTGGVCEHHCSKPFQDAPGAPVRRYCGTSPIYSEGDSVDCRGCAQLRVQEEEAAQAKAKAEAQAAKARARKAQQEEENARAEAAKAAVEATRAQVQRLKVAEQANTQARAQAQKEAEQAKRALEEAWRTASDLKEQQKVLKALEEEAAAARASAKQAMAALRTLE